MCKQHVVGNWLGTMIEIVTLSRHPARLGTDVSFVIIGVVGIISILEVWGKVLVICDEGLIADSRLILFLRITYSLILE